MVSKCYLESECESKRLDLSFLIEFDLTRGLLIRQIACIRILCPINNELMIRQET